MSNASETVYRDLRNAPRGGFKRLLDAHIEPCRECEWTSFGDLKHLCDVHHRLYKSVSRTR